MSTLREDLVVLGYLKEIKLSFRDNFTTISIKTAAEKIGKKADFTSLYT